MNKAKILVVEDDKAVRNLITTTLETQNYQYHTAEKGSEALLEAVSFQPDVMLLDLGLPDMDGIAIIEKVRGWSGMPIIVISARSEDRDKIDALDAGADDYLTKPFSVDELLARLRREADAPAADVMFGGGVDSLEAYQDCFSPYFCAGWEGLDPAMRSEEGLWTPFSALPVVIIYNTKLVVPGQITGWRDLEMASATRLICRSLPRTEGL